MTSVQAVTVPGAAAGWIDTVEQFGSGKLTMYDVLAPAIELGEEGFPVSELAATFVGASARNEFALLTIRSGELQRIRLDGPRQTLVRC